MKNLKIILLLFVTTFSFSTMAQNIGDYIDVVHLKNGSKIKGVIVEQIPGEKIKIKTSDGSEYVFAETDVLKFTREEKPKENLKPKDNPLSYINNYKRKGKGYFFEAEILNGGLGSGLRITNGYRFNQYAKLGFALGGEMINSIYNGPYTGIGGNGYQVNNQTTVLSANLSISGDILDKRITPFYQAELGYGIDPNTINNQSFEVFQGLMSSTMFGVKFKTKKKIEYKLGVDLRTMSLFNSNAFINNPSIGFRFGIGF
ncbi:MAG: hypothetical protein ACPGTO_11390 [Polaribacter sp.]